MNRIAFISDIHGNPIALKACLEKITDLEIDALYFLGDAVGYLPGEKEVLALLEEHRAICQQGNHESMLLNLPTKAIERESSYQLQAVRNRLNDKTLQNISSWPVSREVLVDGKRFWLIHGSPDDPLEGYVYPDTNLSLFMPLPYDVVIMGNTHRPFIKKEGDTTFVNLGSVGLPRDQGNLASFAIYDTALQECQIYRIPFDTEAVLAFAGDTIDPNVRNCFSRVVSEIAGTILE